MGGVLGHTAVHGVHSGSIKVHSGNIGKHSTGNNGVHSGSGVKALVYFYFSFYEDN